MENRPKLKLELSMTDKLIEIIAWGLLLFYWAMAIQSYASLPDTIPIHYNAAGKEDRFGGRWTIFALPSITTISFVGMTILNKFPHVFNYPENMTVEDAPRHYAMATRMMRFVKLALIVVFFLMTFRTIQAATGKSDGMGAWFLPLTLGLIFIPIIYFCSKSLHKKEA